MPSIVNVRNIEAPAGESLSLRTNRTDRLTIDSAGVVTAVGSTSVTGNLTATTFNSFVPINKAGDTITGNLNTANITVSGNNVWHAGNSNRVIDRGNPGTGSPLLLRELDVAHYYNSPGPISAIDISTTMVEDAVYEMFYSCNTSGANIDIIIRPNYTEYAGQFRAFYWGTNGANSLLRQFDQTLPYVYFDHQAGVNGVNPCGRFVIHNYRSRKHIQYQGGDTASASIGTCRWNNGDQWVNIGQLAGLASATDVRVMVRRIG